MITKLPAMPMQEDLGKSELCFRFIDPFFSGIFDDPAIGTYFRWTNESTLEYGAANQ
jgi:hypothetical protein